jgi:uncharacterized protein YjeT (DUF2065 family)
MADGLALLIAPNRMIETLKQALSISPGLIKWGVVGAALGILLLFGAQGLTYQPLWGIVAVMMILKGVFLFSAPDTWRQAVIRWCLAREAVDYRFWGLGLCTLSMLMLDALGWLSNG